MKPKETRAAVRDITVQCPCCEGLVVIIAQGKTMEARAAWRAAMQTELVLGLRTVEDAEEDYRNSHMEEIPGRRTKCE